MAKKTYNPDLDQEKDWIEDFAQYYLVHHDRRMWDLSAPAPRRSVEQPVKAPNKANPVPKWLRDEMAAASELARSLGR